MSNRKTIIWTLAGALTLVILLLAATGVWAEPSPTSVTAPSAPQAVFSNTISFQGRLLDSGGNPVDGSPLLTFRLYTQAEGGVHVWEDAYNVPVANGLFNADLAVPSSLFDGQALWLGVQVEGDAQEMVPRQQILPAPYAFYAKSAPWDGITNVPPELADGDHDTQYSDGTGLALVGTQFSIALTYRLPQTCSDGEIPEWNDTSGEWSCGSDDVGSGAAAWQLGGNAGTTPGMDVLGTTDTVSLTFVVDTIPALRLEPGAVPNLVGGDRANRVSTGITGAVIGGGGSGSDPHWVGGNYGTIGGGVGNVASNWNTTVGGGASNTAGGPDATIGGGFENAVSGYRSTIGGGNNNTVSGSWAIIAGGSYITATGDYAAVGGGWRNIVTATNATIGGGRVNTASSYAATVSGGNSNTASGSYAATVSGGDDNTASGAVATVGGGQQNDATGDVATIAGGRCNKVDGVFGTIAGGGVSSDPFCAYGNDVTDNGGTIGGGGDNQAGDGSTDTGNATYATVAGGRSNTASGSYAIIPGGQNNTAQGDYSFAAGYRAQANHLGSFVWSDPRSASDFSSQHNYQFRARAFGGFRFEDGESLWVEMAYLPTSPISTSTGAYLTGGGVWTNSSDRNLKENFEPVDSRDVLDRLAKLPISTWNYKAEDPDVRHMGPVAQDFYTMFHLGEDDRHIAALDTGGIALAAIQGLYTRNQALEAEVSALKTENATLKKDLNDLEARVAALEQTGMPHPTPILTTWWPLAGLVVLAGIVVARQRRQEGKR
jgi:hypothetical protein